MNRRNFIAGIPAVIVFPILGHTSVSLPTLSLVRRKRLDANAKEVIFADINQGESAKPLQLRSKGNALWIESLTWEGQDGGRHSEIIRKNLPPGKGMMLPTMNDVRSITLVVTCLPLASSSTMVELLG
jgi:hypothetical protein